MTDIKNKNYAIFEALTIILKKKNVLHVGHGRNSCRHKEKF